MCDGPVLSVCYRPDVDQPTPVVDRDYLGAKRGEQNPNPRPKTQNPNPNPNHETDKL